MKILVYFNNGFGNLILLCNTLYNVKLKCEELYGECQLDIIFNLDSRRLSLNLFGEFTEKLSWINNIYWYPRNFPLDKMYDVVIVTRSAIIEEIFNDIIQYAPLCINQNSVDWRFNECHELDFNRKTIYEKLFSLKPRNCGNYEHKFKLPMSENKPNILDSPYVVICNGANVGTWQRKRYHHLSLSTFVSLFKSKYGNKYNIVYVGGLDCKDEGYAFERDHGILNFAGKLNILTSIKVVNDCIAMLTSDTGLMHVADYLDVKLLALFGPSSVYKNGPLGVNSHVLLSDIFCAPCIQTPNFSVCTSWYCMKQIEPKQVLEKFEELL